MWRFTSVAVAPGIILDRNGSLDTFWHGYISKVTSLYLRKRLIMLKETGGQLNTGAGVTILSGKKFKDWLDKTFHGSSYVYLYIVYSNKPAVDRLARISPLDL